MMNTQRVALLPCPFCAGEAQIVTVKGCSAASCADYMCTGHQMALMHKTETAAIAAWNRRAPAALAPGLRLNGFKLADQRERFEAVIRANLAPDYCDDALAMEGDVYAEYATVLAWAAFQAAEKLSTEIVDNPVETAPAVMAPAVAAGALPDLPKPDSKGWIYTSKQMREYAQSCVVAAHAEINRLNAIINTPHADDFLKAVSIEAEHQRQRWGSGHDAGKSPADWFWLVGYLGGKALHAHVESNVEKAEHHIITTAAACANWHRNLFGKTDMRAGIDGNAVLPESEAQ